MIISSAQAEQDALLQAAKAMAAAARTAPKTKGNDFLETLIVTDSDLLRVADKMEEFGNRYDLAFCVRDAGCLRKSGALLLLGIGHHTRGLNESCQFCGSKNCLECTEKHNSCVYDPLDLGIAIGSAVSVGADLRVDNRVMFSAGAGAKELKLFSDEIAIAVGIPLSFSGKSVYFDR